MAHGRKAAGAGFPAAAVKPPLTIVPRSPTEPSTPNGTDDAPSRAATTRPTVPSSRRSRLQFDGIESGQSFDRLNHRWRPTPSATL